MPAYFSIDITIRKSDRYDGIYADFIEILNKAGMKFKSGTWEYMDESLDEIIAWNEKKLQKDFELGYTEHYSNDYRQIFLDYHDFSEVRSFINNVVGNTDFVFSIIIPEDELIIWKDGKGEFDPEILKDLKRIVIDLWNWKPVTAIQTSLELSGGSVNLESLEAGEMPSILPYAVIPKSLVTYEFDENCTVTELQRNGIFIECL